MRYETTINKHKNLVYTSWWVMVAIDIAKITTILPSGTFLCGINMLTQPLHRKMLSSNLMLSNAIYYFWQQSETSCNNSNRSKMAKRALLTDFGIRGERILFLTRRDLRTPSWNVLSAERILTWMKRCPKCSLVTIHSVWIVCVKCGE